MSILTHRIAISASMARSVAIMALLGATFLTGPLTVARAADAPTQLMSTTSRVAATDTKTESVEQRIANLRTALKITADQEPKWEKVAQTMRENASAMQKLAAEKTVQAPQSMTAVEDLQTYEKFAEVHVTGLKALISSFDSLYKSMPDPQKKIADQVFRNFGRDQAPARG